MGKFLSVLGAGVLLTSFSVYVYAGEPARARKPQQATSGLGGKIEIPDNVRSKMTPAVIEALDAMPPDPPMDSGADSETDCPDPYFEIKFTKTECETAHYDRCNVIERNFGTCNGAQMPEGSLVVKDRGIYRLEWKAENALVIWSSCLGFEPTVPDVASTLSEGQSFWHWNGPLYGSSETPAGFSPRERARDHRDGQSWLIPILKGLSPISMAWANGPTQGGNPGFYYIEPVLPGEFTCKAFALRKCGHQWRTKEIDYTYSCTDRGGDGSPR